MKEGIHPKWYPNAKVIVEGEEVMTVGSTLPEISVEIWSGTHPFYTGHAASARYGRPGRSLHASFAEA